MFKKLTMLSMLPLASSLMSCAPNTTATAPPRTVSDFCLIAKAITFSEKHGTDVEDATNKYDTDDTVKQVKDHDLKYEAVCKGAVP